MNQPENERKMTSRNNEIIRIRKEGVSTRMRKTYKIGGWIL